MGFIDVGRKLFEINSLFFALFAQDHVHRLNTEETCQVNGTINIVANSFEKFGSLRLYDLGFLLVASIKSQIHKFLRAIKHILPFSLCCLYEVEAHVKNEIWHEFEISLAQALITSSFTQIF